MQTDVTTQPRNIQAVDLYGCHVSIETFSPDDFSVEVSYDCYNALGERIAHPVWCDRGTGEAMYLFILKTLAFASKQNKPVILAIPELFKEHEPC